VFEAIEEEDRVVENDDGGNPALLGSCNDRAKQLHASPSGLPLNVLANQLFEICLWKPKLVSDALSKQKKKERARKACL
jgi:hypothetical protein